MTSRRKLNIEGGLMQSRRKLQKKNGEKSRSENYIAFYGDNDYNCFPTITSNQQTLDIEY